MVPYKQKRRLDVTSQRNAIIEIAASIMWNKAQENHRIAVMLAEKRGENDETVIKLRKDAKRMEEAVDLMDEFVGCWG